VVEARRNYSLHALQMLLACSLFVIGLCPVAQGDTFTYTYTGNPFNEFIGGAACPPMCSISGSFTLAEPLPDNRPLTLISPLSFSFTDGSATITQANQFITEFLIMTDSQGDIVAWLVVVASQSSPSNSVEFFTDGVFKIGPQDFTCTGPPCTMNVALVDYSPGTWTSSSVPEPSTLLLFGPGFLGMLGFYKKRNWFVHKFLRA
jgi:hypothetical protein